MSFNRRQIKAEARRAMRETKPSIFGATLLLFVILFVVEFLMTKLQNPAFSLRSFMADYDNFDALSDLLLTDAADRGVFSWLLELALSAMECILTYGLVWACLLVSCRTPAGVGSLFDPFAFPFKVIWLNIVTAFFIWLWSLLLIIPGVIAAYRYSLAPYILMDDPDKSAMQCLRESKAMTRGHKWKLFVLDLSFIGWALLCVIPFVILYALPFMVVSRAVYYNKLCGYQPQSEEAPIGPDDYWQQ